MGLQDLTDIRLPVADDRPGQEHAAGFATDHACADHMVPDGKIIFRREMLPDHLPHLFVTGHHDIAHPGAVFGNICAALMEQLGPVEEPVPGIGILFLGGTLGKPQGLIEPAGLHAVQDRAEPAAFRFIGMRKEHRIRIPVPDLLRTHIDAFAVRIDVDEQLGGVQDLVDRLHGVLSPDDREEGDRVQDEQERAGDPEEIAHHQVRCPGRLQVGKAVKDIERVLSFLFDHVVNVDREGFKAV